MTRSLVSTPSVNPQLEEGGSGEREAATLVAEWLDLWGLDTRITEISPNRFNVIAKLDGEGPTLLLNGHLDTVGVGGMIVPPFDAKVEGGRIWGRGSCDMKAGLAAILATTKRLVEEGPRPNLIVAMTADEEHASLGMYALVDSFPSADFAIVTEPTRLAVMPAHKGFLWVRAVFEGRAAHGSRPDLGIDAIRHAALYVSALDDYGDQLTSRPAHPLLKHGSVHAGTIQGGSAASVYPDLCEIVLERRTMPGEKPEKVLQEFQRILDELSEREEDLSASLEQMLERPGTEVPEDSRLVQGLLEAGQGHGIPPVVEGMTAWVDAALLNEIGIPAVCYGPGDIAQAHSADEWVELAQIEKCADVLESFARDLATQVS
ncbi:MAG: ArgE/DapE family deacylase [Gemmatimonadota bacterium]|nr:ArgE/DapE family deacylase [Gemmatimonadota bacterium]